MSTRFILLQVLILSMSFSAIPLQAQYLELYDADKFDQKMQSLESYQLIDVRTPEEYREGHLQQALNLNYNASGFVESLGVLDKGKPVFVYGKNGKRSVPAAVKMVDLGFKNVYHLQGGIVGWTKAGKPIVIEKKESKPSSEDFTSADLKKITNSEKVVLVDFYATWCVPCMKMDPTMDTLSKEFEGKIKIVRVNVEHSKALTKELSIREIPVVNCYISGELVDTFTGYMSISRLRTVIKKLLE